MIAGLLCAACLSVLSKFNTTVITVFQWALPASACRWIHREPLDEEWTALAKKQLKGADPGEKLTWHTPEVKSTFFLFFFKFLNILRETPMAHAWGKVYFDTVMIKRSQMAS